MLVKLTIEALGAADCTLLHADVSLKFMIVEYRRSCYSYIV